MSRLHSAVLNKIQTHLGMLYINMATNLAGQPPLSFLVVAIHVMEVRIQKKEKRRKARKKEALRLKKIKHKKRKRSHYVNTGAASTTLWLM